MVKVRLTRAEALLERVKAGAAAYEAMTPEEKKAHHERVQKNLSSYHELCARVAAAKTRAEKDAIFAEWDCKHGRP